MTVDEAAEIAARAICAHNGWDPEKFLDWGPFVGGSAFRKNPDKEQWRCVVDKFAIREQMMGLDALGLLPEG